MTGSIIPDRNKQAVNLASSVELLCRYGIPRNTVGHSAASYVPKLEAYRHLGDDTQVETASRVLTHAHLNDKPLLGSQFPVVLFSHGGRSRARNTR